MSTLPIARTLAPDLPFKYVGGDAAVDLVNTVDWTRSGPADDRLTSYDRLTRWAEGGELLTARLGESLRARALVHPDRGGRAHRAALELRWCLRRLFVSIAHGEALPDDALAELDRAAARVATHQRLAPARDTAGGPLQWSWVGATEHLDSVLWPVVRSAAELLVSDEARRIRECGAEDCGWIYVDRSRNGLRRWCQMEVCGTREKSRRRAVRRATG
jgi:predicted RNA-binding Zn ribbon-like protein